MSHTEIGKVPGKAWGFLLLIMKISVIAKASHPLVCHEQSAQKHLW